MPVMVLTVGDVVTVARSCMGNPAQARAIVVDVESFEGEPSWQLLFENGATDGFSPDDCELFGVAHIGTLRHLANYAFVSVMQLDRDWQAGTFCAVWRKSA